MSVSKKIRFEIFKRDSFTCQYCGCKAPDVILHADHIKPKSKGGNDDLLNLITSCFDCNMGKKNIELNDNIALNKKRKQLELLQTRKEQIDMMYNWQEELLKLENEQIEKLSKYWNKLTNNEYLLNENGKKTLKKLISKYDFRDLMECMKISIDQYYDETQKGIEKAFTYIERIIINHKKQKENPYLKDLYYIRGIINNRFHYINKWKAIRILKEKYVEGIKIEQLKDIALYTKNWTEWMQIMELPKSKITKKLLDLDVVN
jgi:hypothetical protein